MKVNKEIRIAAPSLSWSLPHGNLKWAGAEERGSDMRRLLVSLVILLLAAGAAAQTTPTSFTENFGTGSRVFDDAVGFLRVRPSGSTAETDYAPGITSPTSFYARLTVQPGNNINGDQIGPCTPGAPQTDNSFSCGGPLTEWGLPWGGFNGQFDTGIDIDQAGSATTSIKIYLDMAFAASVRASGGSVDYRFDWDSVLLDSQGTFLQDYVFNVATGQTGDSCAPSSGGFYVIEVSNNYQRGGANAHDPATPNPPQVCVARSGWYTFQHQFHADASSNLEVDMTALRNSTVVGSWILSPTCLDAQAAEGLCSTGSPLPYSAVGANFFGFFPDQEINNLPIDSILRKPI